MTRMYEKWCLCFSFSLCIFVLVGIIGFFFVKFLCSWRKQALVKTSSVVFSFTCLGHITCGDIFFFFLFS